MSLTLHQMASSLCSVTAVPQDKKLRPRHHNLHFVMFVTNIYNLKKYLNHTRIWMIEKCYYKSESVSNIYSQNYTFSKIKIMWSWLLKITESCWKQVENLFTNTDITAFFLIGLLLHLCTLVYVDNLSLTLKMHDMLKKSCNYKK